MITDEAYYEKSKINVDVANNLGTEIGAMLVGIKATRSMEHRAPT